MARLEALGWSFRLNRCADTVEVNGHPIGEIEKAEIRVALRDIGMAKKIAAAEDAYVALAKKNAYHPVQDYLNSLVWDGADHINALAVCMHSSDPPIVYRDGTSLPLPHVYLYRWLIGAVIKIYTGGQNPMLVWDGPQGIGKSTLARWLCPLPTFFIEGPINPGDKDSDIRLITHVTWEVSELDATTRKADVSALKSFITKQVVTVRPSYGRFDIKKPAMCSLIGTVNNTSGFLADESGSRRFLITKLDQIDRAYMKLDVHQIWAQSVALYRDGETGNLTSEEAAMQGKVNERYEAMNVLSDWLDRSFVFHPEYATPYSMADIITALVSDGFKPSGSNIGQAMELSRVLRKKKARSDHTRDGNRWFGLQLRPRM
jgi:putative DNA primase/helicase